MVGSIFSDRAGELINNITMAGINFGLGQYSSSKASRRAYSQFKDAYQHRHQWEVEDLRKAGLNPILSANAGGQAQGFMSQAPAVDVADVMSKGAHSALAKQQAKAVDSNIALNESQSAKNLAETQKALSDMQIAKDMFQEQVQNFVEERNLKRGLTAQAWANKLLHDAQRSKVPYERDQLYWQSRYFQDAGRHQVASALLAEQEYSFWKNHPELYHEVQQAKAFGQIPNNLHAGVTAISNGVGSGLKATAQALSDFDKNVWDATIGGFLSNIKENFRRNSRDAWMKRNRR